MCACGKAVTDPLSIADDENTYCPDCFDDMLSKGDAAYSKD